MRISDWSADVCSSDLKANSDKLNALGVMMIDLTPAAIGPYCVPPINLKQHAGKREMNVNMVTCGGQATIPMVYAVSRVQKVKYAEIVATVSSKSVGPGKRKNIDERSEEHTSELQSLMRSSYAVFCLKKLHNVL